MFALGVSLHSFDCLTEGDLKSFKLAPLGDEDSISPLLVVSGLSTMARTMVEVVPRALLVVPTLPTAARLASVP